MAFRVGDFSALAGPVFDPYRPAVPREPHPGGRLDPAGQDHGPYCHSQLAGHSDPANGRTTNNFVNARSNGPPIMNHAARRPHFGSKARLFGRFTYFDLCRRPDHSRTAQQLDGRRDHDRLPGLHGWTHIWSPTANHEAGFGFQRQTRHRSADARHQCAGRFGIQRSSFRRRPALHHLRWRGSGINENTYRRQIDNNFQGAISLTWVRGNHTIEDGLQMRLNQFNVFNPGGAFTGVYNFNGEMSRRQRRGQSDSRAGRLPARPRKDVQLRSCRSRSPDGEHQPRRFHPGRLEGDAATHRERRRALRIRVGDENVNDIYSRIDISAVELLVAGQECLAGAGSGRRGSTSRRASASPTLNDKTVVRSAFGIFYSQIFSNMGGIVLYPGFTVPQHFTDPGAGIAPAVPARRRHASCRRAGPRRSSSSSGTCGAGEPASEGSAAQFGAIGPMPYSLQWNSGVQREIARNYCGCQLRGHARAEPTAEPAVQPDSFRARRGTGALGVAIDEPARATVHEPATTSRSSTRERRAITPANQGRAPVHALVSRTATYTFSKSIDDGTGLFKFSQPNGLDNG